MGRIVLESVIVEVEPTGIVAGPATFTVEPGEAVMVVGPNGAGKTSLLKAIAGIYRVSSGRLEVKGKPAYVPQSDMLLPWLTIAENIALPLTLRGASKEEALAKVRMLAARLGLEEHLDKLPREASGGTRRKAAVARGLIQGADVLLLDEPFTGVDAASIAALKDMLMELKESGISMVIVTHQVHVVASFADAAVLLYPPPDGVVDVVELKGLGPGERFRVAEHLLRRLSNRGG